MRHYHHHHHRHWNEGHQIHGQAVSGQALLRRVVPNLNALRRRYIMISMFLGLVALGLVGLAILGFTVFARPFGFSGDMTQPNFAIVVPGMFGAVIMFGIAFGYGGSRIFKINRLFEAINEIEGRDKVTIENLSLANFVGVAATTAIIEKLIATGNLKGYEVIGEVGVARVGMRFTEADFGRQVKVVKEVTATAPQPRKTRCDSCGAAVTGRSGRFCDFCGTKL